MAGQSQFNKLMDMLSITTSSISLPHLPGDVFVLIIGHLEAWDIVRCQMVSKAWRDAFSDQEFLRIAVKKYPHAREAQGLISNNVLSTSAIDSDLLWRTTFNKIACRYFHLTHGRARRIKKYKMATPERLRLTHWFPVSPWEYHESQPGGRLYHLNPLEPWEYHETRPGQQAYLFRNSFWSYEDGLLVFAPAQPFAFDYDSVELASLDPSAKFAIMVLDLESQRGAQVPFDIQGKVVRNLRLKDRTLIIEWAEKEAYHALNDSEYVHRHFASCYDIKIQLTSGDERARRWTISFRSEWKLHFLGLPLNNRDRFFSTHTKDHYAVYLWQPNRSMYTGDEEQPIECLIVWDISQPRKYLPSLDPGGKENPEDFKGGPHVLSRFNYRDLQYYGIRQQSSPSLMKLSLDSQNQTITIRENGCVAGQGYFDPAERLWCAKTTRILFCGKGPHLKREWHGNLPPYRGNCSMDTCDVLDPETWFLGIMDVLDEKADVRFSLAESVFTGKDVQNTAFVRIWALGKMATLDASTTKQVGYMGKIGGDERALVGQNDSQEVVVLRFD
jgi:F-box domain